MVTGWAAALPGVGRLENAACLLAEMDSAWARACLLDDQASTATAVGTKSVDSNVISENEADQILEEAGRFNDLPPTMFAFDESKYSPLKRQIAPSEWKATNRHLPIKLDPTVTNQPRERSPAALQRVIDYTQFYNPRYVADPGERITMCNIAAWDWSRALRVHLPHWKGESEMSANMLFRWVSHPQAGGIYGEGWQPIGATVAQLLANRGLPVFALAENPQPRRHGHVAMVFPAIPALRPAAGSELRPRFATVKNGRSSTSNGIKDLGQTFRWMTPTYFVHRDDFILHPPG